MYQRLKKLMEENANNILFLCGAGISLDAPASLPTVNKFICDVLKESGISNEIIDRVYNQFGKMNYRFESLVDQIRKNCDADLLLTKLFDSSSFNKIHHFLSLMLRKGSSIITTNFDNCIENACYFENYEFSNRFVYSGEDLSNDEKPLSNVLIKIHGSQPIVKEITGELVITIKALAKTERAFKSFPNWRKYLLNLISNKIVVVMGYSCSDDFDIVPLLAESKPKEVVWLNFDYNNFMPIFTDDISNIKINELSKKIPILYYNGRLMPFLLEWSKQASFCLCEGEHKKQFTVKEYIFRLYKTQVEKYVLCNEIFLSYGLYDEVIILGDNLQLRLQKIKSEFRLKNYQYVIEQSREIMESDAPPKILLEILYYLSSALYYKCDYKEAIEIAKKCVLIGWRMKDMDFYLNSLINYASMQYVYASTLSCKDEQENILKHVQKIYHIVENRAEGINIEARANALWGLGDLERYMGNSYKALELLQEALAVLEKIGNVYAINQLESIIKEVKLEMKET